MVKRLFWICSVLILILCVLTGIYSFSTTKTARQQLSQWNQDGVIKELIAYVEDVTDENSENYIPEKDRIAVFDLDGTLVCEQFPIYFEWILFAKRVLEDPNYESTQEMKDLAARILEAGVTKKIPSDMEEVEFGQYAKAFDGMYIEEYKAYVQEFLSQEADCFDGMCYKDAYFRPMVQVIHYLEDNGFTPYICSGTDRDADRVMVSSFCDFPVNHVIGSDSYIRVEDYPEDIYLEKQLDPEDRLVRDGTGVIKNVRFAKVVLIYREIGRKPVLAFGNSSGDISMFTYTTTDNPYKSAAFCLVPDDDEREYAFPEKTQYLTNLCDKYGWHAVSMKNDFLSMYGEGVEKNPYRFEYSTKLLEIYQNNKEAA